MTSTVCPRLSLLKFPRSRKPFCELSTIRQGNLSVCPRMSATMLARLVLTTRSERRLSGARKVGTAFAPVLVSQGSAILPESLLMRNLAGVSFLTSKGQTIRRLSRLAQTACLALSPLRFSRVGICAAVTRVRNGALRSDRSAETAAEVVWHRPSLVVCVPRRSPRR